MKHLSTSGSVALALALICPPQLTAESPWYAEGITFTGDAGGGWNLQWQPTSGRGYFMQFSEDLVNWYFFPVLVAGQIEAQRWWMDSDGDRFFTRLCIVDGIGENPWDGDIDGDGLGNLFEVMNGLNPFKVDSDGNGSADSEGDADGDGLLTAGEFTRSTNPFWMDHPDVQLEVEVKGF